MVRRPPVIDRPVPSRPHPLSLAIVLLALALGSWIHGPGLSHQFTEWDDPGYVTSNPDLDTLDARQVLHQFRTRVLGNYHPVTMLSYSLDMSRGGLDPGTYHATNITLHLVNVILVALFVWLLTGVPLIGALTALIWSVNPMHVEAVGWVSGRKDLLMVFFGLGSLMMYTIHRRRRRSWTLAGSLLLFVLACLSKATAVALVPCLLLVDLFQGRSLRDPRRWWEKWPFVIIALGIGVLAIVAQAEEGALNNAQSDLLQSVVLGVSNLSIYLMDPIVPPLPNPRIRYPGSAMNGATLAAFLSSLLMIGLVIWRRRDQPLLFGSLFFLAALLPVLQFVPVGLALRADRYGYLAFVGPAFLIAHAAVVRVPRAKPAWKWLSLFVVAFGTLAHATIAHERTAIWKNARSVWDAMLRADPSATDMRMNRAVHSALAKDHEHALADLDEVLRQKPGLVQAHLNRGNVYFELARYREAIQDYLHVFQAGQADQEIFTRMLICQYELGGCADLLKNTEAQARSVQGGILLFVLRARCLLDQGDVPAADRELDRIPETERNDGDVLVVRGLAAFARNDSLGGCSALTLAAGKELRLPGLDSLRAHLSSFCPENTSRSARYQPRFQGSPGPFHR